MDLSLISGMDRPALEDLWQKHLPKVQVPNLNLRTLRSVLAYELQVKETGGIARRTAQTLRAYLPEPSVQLRRSDSGSAEGNQKVPRISSQAKPPALTPGTVLVREWNGRRYQVKVLEDGFELDGRTYTSLSKIAKSITGTGWSGPRFFGLVKAPTPKASAGVGLAKAASRKVASHLDATVDHIGSAQNA